MIITEYLTQKLQEYVSEKYSINDFNFEIIKTKKEFDGFYTVVLFPLIPRLKKSPKEISDEIVEFINTEKFINHDRVIFLENFTDDKVLKFISTCDAMIHARYHGETFGLAIAEFSAANKPVITFKKSKDKEHLKILKDKAILYSNENELNKIFELLPETINKQNSWNAYKDYEPANVMKIFNSICLEERKKSLFYILNNFIRDLPWEIKIYFDKLLNILKRPFLRLIPFKIKSKIKLFINIFKK